MIIDILKNSKFQSTKIHQIHLKGNFKHEINYLSQSQESKYWLNQQLSERFQKQIRYYQIAKDKITLVYPPTINHPMNKKISQAKIKNLIAQTNYLSSMLQAYQSILIKKFYRSEDQKPFRKSSYEGESIFSESETEKKNRSNCFSDSDHHPNMPDLYFNQERFMDEIFIHEMHERPTGYNKDEDDKRTKEKIDVLEKSIQVCNEAIQKQFEVKKELEDWNIVEKEEVKVLLGVKSKVMNQTRVESGNKKSQTKKQKTKQNKKCE